MAHVKEGVPTLRMKAAVTRHLLPVLLRMIEIHFPSTCACGVSASCTRNSTACRGSDRGKGRWDCTAGTSHSTCRLRGIDWFLDGCGCSVDEAEASRNASRVRSDRETLHSSGITVTNLRLAGRSDRALVGAPSCFDAKRVSRHHHPLNSQLSRSPHSVHRCVVLTTVSIKGRLNLPQSNLSTFLDAIRRDCCRRPRQIVLQFSSTHQPHTHHTRA